MSNRILFLVVFCGLIASASAQSNFNRFNFTAGTGVGVGRDDVGSYVGNSFQGVVGGGINFSRMFGVDAEYMYYGLGFRSNVIQAQSLHGQTGRMQSVSLDGIVTVPRHYGKVGAYGILGVGFYRRTVSLAHGQLIGPNTVYRPAWRWWDINRDIFGTIVGQQTMSSNSKDAGGFNYGGGVTYRLGSSQAKFYIEGRYHRAYHSDGKTIVMPITVGLRW